MKREEWIDFLEPEAADLMQAEACFQKRERNRKVPRRKWPVLMAACLLLAGLSAGAFAAQKGAGEHLLSWFLADGEKEKELLREMSVQAGMRAEDSGYQIRIEEAVSDGKQIYAVLAVTSLEGNSLEDVYGLDLLPRITKKETIDRNEGSVPGGGWHTEILEQNDPNRMTMLLMLSLSERAEGKYLLLDISKIREIKDGQDQTLAEGSWRLSLPVPKNAGKTVRQWTRAVCGQDTYYVTAVELTPLGVEIKAVKTGGQSGYSKESFQKASVTVVKKDGAVVEAYGEGGGGSFVFCRRQLSWHEIIDPEEITQVRIGDTVLKVD